jgi:hypothetical protein
MATAQRRGRPARVDRRTTPTSRRDPA